MSRGHRLLAAGPLFAALFTGVASLALAAPPGNPGALPPALRGVEIQQRLNEKVPLDLAFRDEAGRGVRLRDYFGKRPVVLALVYYECPMLCTQVLNGLASALGAISLDAARDFEVVTVSFDPRETPELAAGKKRTYLARYRRPGAEAGWHFLTGDATAIAALTEAVGFRYRFDPQTDQFAHGSAVFVLTPGGTLSRYLYGIEYAPRDLRLALIESAQGRIGTPVDQVLLYCFHYDPTTGKYGAVAMNIIRLGGIVTIAALSLFLLAAWRKERRGRGRVGAPNGAG